MRTAVPAAVNVTVTDPNPPRLIGASASTNQVIVTFSKRLDQATATNTGSGFSLAQATAGSDGDNNSGNEATATNTGAVG